MKRALPFALALALLLAVPAVPQADDPLPKRVGKLEEIVVQQQAILKTVQEHMQVQAARAAALAHQLDVAEKKGFVYPAPNTDARKALLKGLRALAGAKKPAPTEAEK